MKRVFKKNRVKNPRQFKPPHEKKSGKKWNWENVHSPEIKKMFSSKQWQQLRNWVLMKHPLCFIDGCNNPATEVHHIKPVRFFIELFFVISNLAPLCDDCHEKVNSAYRRGIDPEILFPKERRLEL